MAKAILEFNLDEPQDVNAHKRAVSATDVYIALFTMTNELFRPARKHGYDDPNLNNLLETSGTYKDEDGHECSIGHEIVSKLEEKFYEILKEYNVDMENLE